MQHSEAHTDPPPAIGTMAAPATRWRLAWRRPTKRGRRPGPLHGPLSLALQGGGSFGAFTWGVLDHLLAEERVAFDVVSGASAGAVNAVLLADGLAEGGPDAARRRLDAFWGRIGALGAPASLGPVGRAVAQAAGTVTLRLAAQLASPYQFNPLGLDPLRDLLGGMVDFERLRAAAPVRLLIAATRVRDGRPRLFPNAEITLDAVLASACLPMLHHAVEIDGEPYWDGGYSANPPLRQVVLEQRAADDVLLVQVAPEERAGTPRTMPDITRRSREIAFGSALQRELEALDELAALCRRGGLFRPRACRRLERLRRIVAEQVVEDLGRASPMDTDPAFLTRLRDAGAQAAEAWLAEPERAA
jgi:NTE family protein